MIKQLNVKNYKSLSSNTLNLGNLNVFIGANGAGKSNFIDVLEFCRDCSIRGLAFAIA